MQTIEYTLPPTGTGFQFEYNPTSKQKYVATVIGYHIEHNTDTGNTTVQYRISYGNPGMNYMVGNVSPSTVARAKFNQVTN